MALDWLKTMFSKTRQGKFKDRQTGSEPLLDNIGVIRRHKEATKLGHYSLFDLLINILKEQH